MLDKAPDDEAQPSVGDLARINRFLGGYVTLRRLMRQVAAPSNSFSLLDVGAASGDMARRIRKYYPRARVTCFDYLPDHLRNADYPKIAGDAFALPFAQSSFDFVFSSLFLHHFEDRQVIELLSRFSGIARKAVLAIDLERGPLGYRFIPATRWLFGWHPITLHDAPVSVQAAFKRGELLTLARRAGLANATVQVHRPWSRLSLAAVLND